MPHEPWRAGALTGATGWQAGHETVTGMGGPEIITGGAGLHTQAGQAVAGGHGLGQGPLM